MANGPWYYRQLLEDLEKLPTTDSEWMDAVKKTPSLIRQHPNPSEAIQLAAVGKKGSAIQCIENPSEAVQIAAVKKWGSAIQYIKDPSEAVQLAAVKKNPFALNLIKDPSEKLWIYSAMRHGFNPADPDNPRNKKRFLTWMLKVIKSDLQSKCPIRTELVFMAKQMHAYLEKQGVIWPELKAVLRSAGAN